jgi:diadenosine tetraphosphate (Ap4A) HIT family hydrolase
MVAHILSLVQLDFLSSANIENVRNKSMSVKYLRDEKEFGCRFCAVLDGAQDIFGSIWHRNQSYRALVSLGAFIPGWTLICPLKHTCNLSDHYERSDFWKFASESSSVISSRYGKCALFEHGTHTEMSATGCGVGHAHAHLVPLGFSLEDEARRVATEWEWINCLATEVKSFTKGEEYLFVATQFNGSATRGSLCILKEPTSQFFRRVIAGKCGIGEMYDYKKYPMIEIASRSADQLRKSASELYVGA